MKTLTLPPMQLRPPTAGFHRALKLFQAAAVRVPAYKQFLAQHKINPAKIRTPADFTQVPPTDKPDYVSRYRLPELCWDGTLGSVRQYPMSSGTSGQPFFWPTTSSQDAICGRLFQRLYEQIFATRQASTLAVVSFGLGGWKAGLEFYNAARWVGDRGSRLAVITPGLDLEAVVSQIKHLAPLHQRLVIAGYPPFTKDILNYGVKHGLRWSDFDLRLITAGEAISEAWRDGVLRLMGGEPDSARIINLYGMSEAGVLAHETPLSISLRRQGEMADRVGGREQIGLHQYDPAKRWFEVGADGVLLLTTDAGLPLIRYHTRDRGGLVPATALKQPGQLPFLYLLGRNDQSVQLYAVNIYVENIKAALEERPLTSSLTGIFTMQAKHRRNLDQYLQIEVELTPGRTAEKALTKAITTLLVEKLCLLNSEYNKLFTSIGRRAVPKVVLRPAGQIGYVPGRKHKWVRRG